MLSREHALQILEAAYAARARGDKAALAQYWSEGARFRIAADANYLPTIPLTADHAMEAIGGLMDRFTFTDLQRLEAVFEDNKVAVRWAANVSYAGRPPVRTELMDLIHMDDDGRIQSFVQFADTAQMKGLVEA